MSTIMFDPESAARFRTHLQRFNHDLQEQFSDMLAHWESLGDVWNDAMYERFGDALKEVAHGVERYLAMTDAHDQYLRRVIDAGERYTGTRMP